MTVLQNNFHERSWMTSAEIQQINQLAKQLTGKTPTDFPAGMQVTTDFNNPIYYIDYGVVMDSSEPLQSEIEHAKKVCKDIPDGTDDMEIACCYMPNLIYGITLSDNQVVENYPGMFINDAKIRLELIKLTDGFSIQKILASNKLPEPVEFSIKVDNLSQAIEIFKQQSADILKTWQ